MILNPFLAQRLAEAYIQEALREAEQDRLIRLAQGSSPVRRGRLTLVLTLNALLGLAGGGERAPR